jgi:hypothetical protein
MVCGVGMRFAGLPWHRQNRTGDFWDMTEALSELRASSLAMSKALRERDERLDALEALLYRCYRVLKHLDDRDKGMCFSIVGEIEEALASTPGDGE